MYSVKLWNLSTQDYLLTVVYKQFSFIKAGNYICSPES